MKVRLTIVEHEFNKGDYQLISSYNVPGKNMINLSSWLKGYAYAFQDKNNVQRIITFSFNDNIRTIIKTGILLDKLKIETIL